MGITSFSSYQTANLCLICCCLEFDHKYKLKLARLHNYSFDSVVGLGTCIVVNIHIYINYSCMVVELSISYNPQHNPMLA